MTVVRLSFYDDDRGPLGTREITDGRVTLSLPAGAHEVTVNLVIPEPAGLAGATDAEVLDAAVRLLDRYPEPGPAGLDELMAVVRKVLTRLAGRAREAGEPAPADLARQAHQRWGSES